MHRRTLLPAAFLLAMLIAPASSLADLAKPKDPRALQHFDEGNRFYRVREFDSAIAEFKKSLLIEESTAGWYNIAQAHRQLGHYDEAIWYYKRLLDRGKLTGAESARIRGLVDAMEAEKAQAARSKPPIEPGPDKSLGAPLDPAGERPDLGRTAPQEPAIAMRVDPWYADRLGWTLAAGGTIVAMVGVGFLFNASSLRGDADNEPTASERERLRDLASSRQTLGIAFGIGGGALLAVGVIKLAIAPKGAGAETRIGVAFGPNWLALQGRF